MQIFKIAAAFGGLCVSAPAFACASCGCTLTADWLSQGLAAQPGTTAIVRYDYVPQTRLHTGTRGVTDIEKALPAEREIERYTYNHYVNLSVDRQFASDWGVNAQLPYVARPHRTVAEGDTEPSFSRTEGIGDLRLTARWQGFKTPGCVTGVQLGLVVPTGRFRQTFRSGPATGEGVDRGLQTGAGVFQLVVSAYVFGRLTPRVDYVVQLEGQAPFGSRDLYTPGKTGQASIGLHYTRWRRIVPQLDMSFKITGRDDGINSDRPNSGGEQLTVAPGVIVPVVPRLSLFGYLQVPVYQRVNGYQLTPALTTSVGVQMRL